MCTIGALRLSDREYLVFKNKDFARPSYNDAVAITPRWFGPRGLETFAENADGADVHSGLSIGANRNGLLCCDSHVKGGGAKGPNYDLLVESALHRAVDLASALEIIQNRVSRTPGWWGNLILADAGRLAAVEVRGRETRIEYGEDRVVRTNHQPLFHERASPDGIVCSAPRFAAARARLSRAKSLDDVLSLLSSHDDGDAGVCNHGPTFTTVYSYVLHRRDDETFLYVSRGAPCRNARRKLKAPIGEAWSENAAAQFIREYPGATEAEANGVALGP